MCIQKRPNPTKFTPKLDSEDNMFEKINRLDNLGMHKQADKLEKTLLAVNNFMLTKKKITPNQQINTKLDVINSNVLDLKDTVEEAGGEEAEEKTKDDNYDI